MHRSLILLLTLLGCADTVVSVGGDTGRSDHVSTDAQNEVVSADTIATDAVAADSNDASVRDGEVDGALPPCETEPSRVVQLLPGYHVHFALTERGCVWVWGAYQEPVSPPSFTPFARFPSPTSQVPELIPIPGHFRAVHRTDQEFCGVRTDDDTAWCWSRLGIMQLRHEQRIREIIPLYTFGGHCLLVADGSVWCRGRLGLEGDSNTPLRRIDALGEVEHIQDCGGGIASFDEVRGLRIWFPPGPLSTRAHPPDIISNTCTHSGGADCYLTRAGTVHCAGLNSNYVTGDPDRDSVSVLPLRQIEELSDVAEVSGDSLRMGVRRRDGSLWTWGVSRMPTDGDSRSGAVRTPTRISDVSDAVHMALWRRALLFVRRDGSVWRHDSWFDGPADNARPVRIARFGER